MRRKALIGGTVTTIVITLLVLSLTIGIYVIFKAPGILQDNAIDIPEDFEPFAGATLREQIVIQAADSQASGQLQQFLYTIEVEWDGKSMPLMTALRKYAYCREKDEIHMCEEWPPGPPIETAIRNGMDDIVKYSGEGERPYHVRIHLEDTVLFDIGGRGDQSTFVFLKPIPGRQHVKIQFGLASGSFSLGVESQ